MMMMILYWWCDNAMPHAVTTIPAIDADKLDGKDGADSNSGCDSVWHKDKVLMILDAVD